MFDAREFFDTRPVRSKAEMDLAFAAMQHLCDFLLTHRNELFESEDERLLARQLALVQSAYIRCERKELENIVRHSPHLLEHVTTVMAEFSFHQKAVQTRQLLPMAAFVRWLSAVTRGDRGRAAFVACFGTAALTCYYGIDHGFDEYLGEKNSWRSQKSHACEAFWRRWGGEELGLRAFLASYQPAAAPRRKEAAHGAL